MSKTNKVSVVLPIYNVEQYISQCLDSIIKQKHSNLEILCIDDCSPDNSVEIVKQYMQKDSRIKLIQHNQNKYLGGARNTGIENSTGKYIVFIDTDDMISEDFISSLYKSAELDDADFAYNHNIIFYYEDINLYKQPKGKFSHIKNNFYTSACLKIYNLNFLITNNIKFVENARYEDNHFWYLVQSYAKKFTITDKGEYYYRRNNSSIMAQKRTLLKNHDLLRLFDIYLQTVKSNPKNFKAVKVDILKTKNHFKYNSLKNKIEFYKILKNMVKDFKVDYLKLFSKKELKYIKFVKYSNFIIFYLRYGNSLSNILKFK